MLNYNQNDLINALAINTAANSLISNIIDHPDALSTELAESVYSLLKMQKHLLESACAALE